MDSADFVIQYRKQAEELRMGAAYLLRMAAEYDRLACAAFMLAEPPQNVRAEPQSPSHEMN